MNNADYFDQIDNSNKNEEPNFVEQVKNDEIVVPFLPEISEVLKGYSRESKSEYRNRDLPAKL